MITRFFAIALCSLLFTNLFSFHVDKWVKDIDGNIVIIGRYFSPPENPIKPGVPGGGWIVGDGVKPEFPPSSYSLADFCAGVPLPNSFRIGLGMGDLTQLEQNRERLCSQSAAVLEQGLPVMQAIKDEASRIIDAGEIVVDPANTDLLVNKPTYFFATAHEMFSSVVVSGYDVPIRVQPISYEWNFGDGSSLTTSSPGGYWPDGDVKHSYSQQGSYLPELIVRWSVFVQLPEGDWVQLLGNGITTVKGPQLAVVNAYSVLTLPS